MLRIARNAPIVEPITATQVLNDTSSRGLVGDAALPRGASGPDATGAGVGGTKAVALDMSLAPGLALCRWEPRPTFLAAAGRSAVGLKRDGSSPGCAARSW